MAATLGHNTHGHIRGVVQNFAGNAAHCVFFDAGIPMQTKKNGSRVNALRLFQNTRRSAAATVGNLACDLHVLYAGCQQHVLSLLHKRRNLLAGLALPKFLELGELINQRVGNEAI